MRYKGAQDAMPTAIHTLERPLAPASARRRHPLPHLLADTNPDHGVAVLEVSS